MKKRFFGLLALVLLLALALGASPAMAAEATRSIVAEPMYVNCGTYRLNIKNWSWDERVISLKSSKPEIIEVEDKDQLWVIPRKAGKSKITLKYKLNGKSYTIYKTLTVGKYPNAVKSLTINGKRIVLKNDSRVRYWFEGELDSKPIYITINLKPNSGWTSKVKGYKFDMENDFKRSKLTVSNNKKIKVPKDYCAEVIYTLTNKKGTTFQYTISIDRVGE